MNTSAIEEATPMKFIIDGLTYDVASATPVAIDRGALDRYNNDLDPGVEQERYENVLYKTKSGRFFVHNHSTTKYEKGKPVVSDSAFAKTADEALRWISQNNAAILDDAGLPLPPDA